MFSRRNIHNLLTAVLLAVVAMALMPWGASAAERIPGQVRVKFTVEAARGLSPDNFRGRGQSATRIPDFDALARDLGVSEVRSRRHPVQNARLDAQLGISRWYTLTIPPNADIDNVLARLQRNPNVEYAVAVYESENFAVPNDTYYANNWGLNNTAQLLNGTACSPQPSHTCGTAVGTVGFDGGLQLAWDQPQGYGDPSVVIAIIDGSGVDVDHPDLNIVPGYDFKDDDSNPDAASGDLHGTGCAGIAAAIANNGLGVTGVAGGCSVMPLRAGGTAAVSDALIYAADNGVDVLSMSFGWPGLSVQKDLEDALEYAYLSDVVMFGATGNENYFALYLPANHHGVIGVGAASPCGTRKRSSTDASGISCDNEEWDSNYGSSIQDAPDAVDMLAPTILPSLNLVGEGNTVDGGSADYIWTFNGTSCASPFAAGVAALVRSRYPSWTADQVRQRMVATATDVVDVEAGAGWDQFTGYGLVNAAGAVGGVTARTVGVGYLTIQAAIDASNDFDTVNVPAGTYPEVIDFHGKQIRVRSLAGAAATIIDGTGLGDAVVTMNSGETRASILRGFTITGGTGHYFIDSNTGGGLFIHLSDATIDQCVFDGNSADNGGAVYLQGSRALIRDSFIGAPGGAGNTATNYGGGLYVANTSSSGDETLIFNTSFVGNTATSVGGGLGAQNSKLRIIGCTFNANTAAGGGAIQTLSSDVLNVLSCTFVNNQAANNGGAVNLSPAGKGYFWQCDFSGNQATSGNGGAIRANGDSLVVYSSRFFDNTASGRGGAIWTSVPTVLLHATIAGNEAQGGGANDGGGGVYVTGVADVENTIVWGNTVSNGDATEFAQIKNNGGTLNLTSTCIEGLSTLTGTNLTGVDPMFVNPGAGNLHLASGSPVRDIGTGGAATWDAPYDLDGNPREVACPDLGAYEYQIPISGVYHVPEDFSVIQCALDFAANGDSIIVAPGTYNESLDYLGKEVVLKSSGGPAVTTLDGTGLSARLVTMNSGETVNSVLDGFTLANSAPAGGSKGAGLHVRDGAAQVSNCWFEADTALTGGAVAVTNSRLLMVSCRFVNNTASFDNGGAIYFDGVPVSGTTTSTLSGIDFVNNTAVNGGAVCIDAGDVVMTACSFAGNSATAGGAVQVNTGSTCDMSACDFEGNQATNNGGALRLRADVTVVSSRFYENAANTDDSGNNGGGAVEVDGAADVTLAYCTIVQNHTGANTTSTGGGVNASDSGTSITLTDCILWGNTSTDAPNTEDAQIHSTATTTVVNYSIVEGLSAFAGNFNGGADPKFVDQAGGDLHTLFGSPAIDSGNNAWLALGVDKDLDGNPRVDNGTSDRGAYEHVIVTAVGDQPVLPVKTAMYPATPNPFNPQTTIAFDVAEAGPVALRVYNVSGQLVTTLWNGYTGSGHHSFRWNGISDAGTPVASGVYFVRMTATGFTKTQKVVLLK